MTIDERIDAAFKAGDLEALRAAADDPSVIPNGGPAPIRPFERASTITETPEEMARKANLLDIADRLRM